MDFAEITAVVVAVVVAVHNVDRETVPQTVTKALRTTVNIDRRSQGETVHHPCHIPRTRVRRRLVIVDSDGPHSEPKSTVSPFNHYRGFD